VSLLASDSAVLSADALELIAGGLARTVDPDGVAIAACESRAYVEILATEEYNAWLIAWAPSGALEPHDHGGSAGAVHVVRGRLLETYSDDPGRPLRNRAADRGDTFIVPPHRIHEVWNPGRDVAVSVHVYSPPLRDMKFYEFD
jgi:predicted metal-dependent enzyme (double-stranded beta helix superfamily)